MNWNEGFKRVRWAFLGISWLIFIVINANGQTPAGQWGEYAVYMLFFTGGVVLFARLCIWIVRGFTSKGSKVPS